MSDEYPIGRAYAAWQALEILETDALTVDLRRDGDVHVHVHTHSRERDIEALTRILRRDGWTEERHASRDGIHVIASGPVTILWTDGPLSATAQVRILIDQQPDSLSDDTRVPELDDAAVTS